MVKPQELKQIRTLFCFYIQKFTPYLSSAGPPEGGNGYSVGVNHGFGTSFQKASGHPATALWFNRGMGPKIQGFISGLLEAKASLWFTPVC